MSDMTDLDYIFLERDTPAWNAAWAALAGYILGARLGDGTDVAQENAVSGEGWQYMGSTRDDAGQIVHEFRHRDHPATFCSYNVKLPVPTPSSLPDDADLVQF